MPPAFLVTGVAASRAVSGLRLLRLAATLAAFAAPAGAALADTAGEGCGDAAAILRRAYPDAAPAGEAGHFRLDGATSAALPGDGIGGDPFAVTCKVWPADDSLLLVAVPRMNDKESDDIAHVGDLELLVVDRASLAVRQRLLLPGLMSDDAVRIEDVGFDTARYDLAPGRRAFGLRIHRVGSSHANPFEEDDLRLFAVAGGRLDMVVDGLVVLRNGGEWDTNCAGEFSSSKVTLAMTGGSHHGYRDILAQEHFEESRAESKTPEDCDEHVTAAGNRRYVLSYDGRRYGVPKELASLP